MLPPKFLYLGIEAHRRDIEVSLSEIFDALEFPEGTPELEKLTSVAAGLKELGLIVVPDFNIGAPDTRRILRRDVSGIDTVATAKQEIEHGEASRCEFKASFFFHWDRYKANNETPISQLRSDEVVDSALRAIAAFLNTEGGVLYFGIADDRTALGLEKDFQVCGKPGPDGWQLRVRDLIKTRFFQGDQVNNYVAIELFEIESNITIARVSVTARKNLSLVKAKDRYQLFCRQGNRTIEIGMETIEEFLLSRQRTARA